MSFTQPCFIRKNTAELRKKLEELGYRVLPTVTAEKSHALQVDNTGFVFGYAQHGIDCGDNEDLFLALAALREDTDEGQWFVMDVEVYSNISKGAWFKATGINGGRHIGTQIDPLYCHNATAQEIMEHFKK